MVGKDPGHARDHDWLIATALAVRDRIVDRWIETDAPNLPRRPQARLLLLARIPDRPPAVRRAVGNLGLTATARAALRDLGVDLDRLRKLEPDAALGNGGLGRLAACFMESMATLGDPGARLRHPLRPRHLPAGAEGRLAARVAGGLAVVRQPVGVRAAGGRLHDRLRRHRRGVVAARDGTPRYVWHPAESGRRRRLRHADRRLARPARQHAAAVVGARGRSAVARRLQPRRPRRRAGRPRAARGDLARALSERRDAGGPGAAAAAGVLLRVGVAAGPAAPAQGSSTASSSSLRRPRRDPAERHASGHRRSRADAPAGRRARHAVGASRGRSRRRSSTTPTTRCCRRRSRPGRCRCSRACCRGTCRSSTASTRCISTRCAPRAATTTASCRRSR